MKRFLILFVLLFLAMTLIIALPAGAAKPQCDDTLPGYTPEHLSCNKDDPGDETPLYGTMCDPADWPDNARGIQEDDFSFTLSGKRDMACVDVISAGGPWKVTIDGEGARALTIIPRDSVSPGDSCGGWVLRNTVYDHGVGNELILGYDGIVPAATINACGLDFPEWVDISLVNPEICVETVGDQCLVDEMLDVEHPLVLLTFLSGSRGGVTTISVDLP